MLLSCTRIAFLPSEPGYAFPPLAIPDLAPVSSHRRHLSQNPLWIFDLNFHTLSFSLTGAYDPLTRYLLPGCPTLFGSYNLPSVSIG